jgi:hypothetical protein
MRDPGEILGSHGSEHEHVTSCSQVEIDYISEVHATI